ncbi:MAG: cysteine--tRNA ligase [Bacteroidota bacterium]|nr:cysteine--tRNA ligase [Bacteroidota bacterium]
MPIKIHNTLSRHKEEFKPIHEGRVGIYVCGPTVYGHSHIGHAKSYVSFDVIVRYLRFVGYKVLYIQNITDVGHLTDDADEGEDKIQKQSRIDKVHPMEIVQKYTQSYFEDMDALGVQRPDISPIASGHIIEQIEIVKELLSKGFAYEVNGSVYFDVSMFSEYGKLSGRSVEELIAGARVDVSPEKHHPADFALWKKAEPEHIMQWESPWGKGYPGWHLECSAMSTKYLGQPFDIHGGGLENQFPHHECEIAQSEAVTGKPFVRYWIHNNMVTVNGQKMGKSLGNVINLKDAFKKYHPLVVRFFILQSHYRSTLDFSDEALKGAEKGLDKLHNTVRNIKDELPKAKGNETNIDFDGFKGKFLEAMDDDFNTPQAIAVLFDFSREINANLAEGKMTAADLQKAHQLFNKLGGIILGIIPETFQTEAKVSIESDLVNLILELRAEIRSQKLWQLSDKIRDGLSKIGITVEDKKEGVSWKRK